MAVIYNEVANMPKKLLSSATDNKQVCKSTLLMGKCHSITPN